MKNYLLLLFAFLSFCLTMTAQSKVKRENTKEANDTKTESNSYNRWSFELNFGQSRGVRPYSASNYSSNPDKFLGKFQLNSFESGARYMVNPKFGFKIDFNYNKFINNSDSQITAIEMHQIRFGFQGVINIVRLLNLQEQAGRFGFLFHGGVQFNAMSPKKINSTITDINDSTQFNGGLIFGFTPQFRITHNLAITADLTIVNNYKQQFNENGTNYSSKSISISGDQTIWTTGKQVSTTIGFSYSFGNNNIHGDWAIIQSKEMEDFNSLDKKVGDLESLMNDVDKDGVPDYLDVENNSIAGVAVDTKGRMIDININGIADNLEEYIEKTIKNNVVHDNISSSSNNISTEKSAANFFQRLPSTGLPVRLNEYFDKKATLEDCRRKIIDVIINDLKVDSENYRYFAIGNDSFGIVTSNECITPDGKPFDDKSCLKEKCFYNKFFCHHEGYSQLYVFLVVKKVLGERNFDVNDALMERMFYDDELQNTPSNVPILLNGKKVLAQEYSIIVKHVEFHLDSKFGNPQIQKEATYDFKNRIKSFFKQ